MEKGNQGQTGAISSRTQYLMVLLMYGYSNYGVQIILLTLFIVNRFFFIVVGVSEGTHNNRIRLRRSNDRACLMGQSSRSVAQGIFRRRYVYVIDYSELPSD